MMNPLPLCVFMLAMSGCTTAQETADIAFLLDGSGSVTADQFTTMKTFVKNVTRALLDFDTLFAFVQYSADTTIHVDFTQFNRTDFENQVDNITQIELFTNTAKGIQTVVEDVFISSAGARPEANRILIVITDGLSHDAQDFPNATALADEKNITRYAIGVGNAFTSNTALGQLNSIASSPASDHVFRVDSFEVLEQIASTLEKSIIPTADVVVIGMRLEVSSTKSLNETEIEEQILKPFEDQLRDQGIAVAGIKLRRVYKIEP
ncbi:integrin alpha-D-like [Sardina pilchardus]|uniref:integrin alpha-D-like n=1 Tax=Sardina pilchardus TaxID=27697 RepID=UPI002E0DCCA9